MLQRQISLLKKLSEQHTEHAHDLIAIQFALEALHSADSQITNVMGTKFSDLQALLARDHAGAEGDNRYPTDAPDFYISINRKIIRAMCILGARQTARHLKRIQSKELQLAHGFIHERYRFKKRKESSSHGETGGQKQKNIYQPLIGEIRRLFINATKAKPHLSSKNDYANHIHADVVNFIQKDADRYKRVGPKDKTLAYAYQNYILRQVKDIKIK